MNKKIQTSMCLAAMIGCSMMLSGCLSARMQSMGAAMMPVAHQPRMAPQGDSQKFSLAVDAMGSPVVSGLNVDGGFAAGAAATFAYRPKGNQWPLFAELSASGFGGKVNFGYTDYKGVSDGYKAWLKTKAGKDDYSFWNLQQRLLVGGDFYVASHFMVGVGAGVLLYEGGGDYDEMRDDLEKLKLAKNLDDSFGVSPIASFWLGFPISDKVGTITLQGTSDFSMDVWNFDAGVSYFHPSGFHGGVSYNAQLGVSLSVGKSFMF